ncbi:hypothetical protein [Pseudomonas graminis]|uniref:Uncharacterized protein n=1 Tax=Pseudomonas graminis TaxID=158627 RepID=A0A1C2ECK8_9PSED|nr:hypothetical protein [Pseudomonas graminis]OCX24804.1 hypothetical protein BBI10_04085 [Pseudomonas graminis]
MAPSNVKLPYLRLAYLLCGIALTLLGIGGLIVHSWFVGGVLGAIGLTALGIAAYPERETFNRIWNDGAWVDVANLVVHVLEFLTS